eukprot:10927372-Karenia_brevis.AAC.1
MTSNQAVFVIFATLVVCVIGSGICNPESGIKEHSQGSEIQMRVHELGSRTRIWRRSRGG